MSFSPIQSLKREFPYDNTILASPTKKKRQDENNQNILSFPFNRSGASTPLTSKKIVPQAKPQKIEICSFDYDDASKGKCILIPGFSNPFIADQFGEGSNHKVYTFRENKQITITKNSYFSFFEEGTYSLKNIVLKVLRPDMAPNTKKTAIELGKKFANNQDPLFTKIYFYGEDGASFEEKVQPFSNYYLSSYKDAMSKGTALMKKVFEKNMEAKKTIYFDVKPDNIGFNDQGAALILDREESGDSEDYLYDISRDLIAWMNFGNPEQHVRTFRFAQLTENFPERELKICKEYIDKINNE